MAELLRKSSVVLLIDHINTTWEALFDEVIGSTVPGKVNRKKVDFLGGLLKEQEDFARSLGLAANLEYAQYLRIRHKEAWKQVKVGKMGYADFTIIMARIRAQDERLKFLKSHNN